MFVLELVFIATEGVFFKHVAAYIIKQEFLLDILLLCVLLLYTFCFDYGYGCFSLFDTESVRLYRLAFVWVRDGFQSNPSRVLYARGFVATYTKQELFNR